MPLFDQSSSHTVARGTFGVGDLRWTMAIDQLHVHKAWLVVVEVAAWRWMGAV